MNRRELITGLGAAAVGAAAGKSTPEPAKFTKHIRSTAGDIGASDTRVWLDGREVTKDCRAADTKLGVVEMIVREPVFHFALHFGEVRVEVGGKVYPS